MLKKTVIFLLIASTFQVASSWAGMMDIEGSNTSGGNDTLGSAQDMGIVSNVNPLTVFGWVDINNQNDVDFYQFTVTDSSLSLFFDIDFAEDLAQTDDNDLYLDTALWIFNAMGELIAWNDDNYHFKTGAANEGTDPGSDGFGDHDSFIGGLSLENGNYFAAVSYFKNSANGWFQNGLTITPLTYSGDAISGTTPDTSFSNYDVCSDPTEPANQCIGQYQLQIRTSFNPIPEPDFFPLVGVGLLSMYVRRRFFPAKLQRA